MNMIIMPLLAAALSTPLLKVGTVKRPPVANDPVFNSVTHVWHLEEGTGVTRADSKGSISLTDSFSVPNIAGKHNNSANFSIETWLTSDAFVLNRPYTIAMWVYESTGQGFADTGILLKSDGVTTIHIEIQGNASPSNVLCDESGQSADSLASFILNAWNLIVYTVDGSGVGHVSVNGENFHDAAAPSPSSPGSSTLNIGNVDQDDSIPRIDELMIWSVALNQSQVLTLYASGSGLFYSP